MNHKNKSNKKKRRMYQPCKKLKFYNIKGGSNTHSVVRTITNRRLACSVRNIRAHWYDVC